MPRMSAKQILETYSSELREIEPEFSPPVRRQGALRAPPFLYSVIPAEFRVEMEKRASSTTTTTTTTNVVARKDTKIVVHIVSYSAADTDNVANMWPLIHRWLQFALSKTPGRRCTSAGLQVFFYLTDYVKHLPKNRILDQWMDYRHVNTAVTTSCPHTTNNNTIVIFRKEEWLRAFIHETIHYLGWDFSGSHAASKAANDVILKEWRGLPANFNLCVYESFCDSWATIFQVLLLKGGGHNRKRKNTIELCMEKERRHSLAQCAKIMEHLGITWAELETPGSMATYRENTPILSYFVLKSAAMFFMDDFVGMFSSSEAASSEAASGKATSGKATSSKAASSEATSGEATSGKATSSKATDAFQIPRSESKSTTEVSAACFYSRFLAWGLQNARFRKSVVDAGNGAPKADRESLRMSISGF